ncbi:MAG TPA: cytidine deaminase [Alkalispirochaeta sp.]|nr:cytidine deaminase [Alkalispirochaeta sp.]
MNNIQDPGVQTSFEHAVTARRNAYTPYSHYQVGAAVRIANTGETISACNVENVSYGATVCAERNAIFAVVARHGQVNIDHLVLVTDDDPPAVPCALCLQVLQEFCPQDLPIHLATLEGIQETVTLGALLPHPFKVFHEHS